MPCFCKVVNISGGSLYNTYVQSSTDVEVSWNFSISSWIDRMGRRNLVQISPRSTTSKLNPAFHTVTGVRTSAQLVIDRPLDLFSLDIERN